MSSVPSAFASRFAQRIPYAFARTHGVLAQGEEGDAIIVLTRPDATADGIAESKRVLQRPLVTRAVDAQRFAPNWRARTTRARRRRRN